MMLKKLDKKASAYKVDLAAIEGDGSFPMSKMRIVDFA